MMMYWEMVKSALHNEKGQGMVEYGLIIAFVAVVALAGVKLLGTGISGLFNGISFTGQ